MNTAALPFSPSSHLWTMGSQSKVLVQDLRVSAYTIPTESPESDGTLEWNRTVLVLVTARAGGKQGLLYPDLSRPGIGLALKERDARKFAA